MVDYSTSNSGSGNTMIAGHHTLGTGLLYPGQNKWGGSNLTRKRGLKGGTYGPASPCRTIVGEERALRVAELMMRGEITDVVSQANSASQMRSTS